MYTAIQVAHLFHLARETVRQYSLEFSAVLSPGANPGTGRTRVYTDDDLEVFALIVEMKGQGRQYDDIHASLANGQRGSIPESAGAMIPADVPKPTQLQARVNMLEAQLASKHDEITRLTALLDRSDTQLSESRKEIRALYEEIAVLKAGKPRID